VDSLSLFDADLQPATDAAVPPASSAPPASPAPAGPPGGAHRGEGAPGGQPRRTGPRLLAVDGNSLAHRAFHAYGAIGLADSSGADRSGLYGFLALLAAVSDKVSPDATVVGFDCRERSVRKEHHPGYKANRVEKDPALYALFDLIVAVLDDLGVAMVVEPGWEADDVIGSAAAATEQAGWQCTIATSDKDAFGLISDSTTVLRLRSGLDNAVEMTPARLRREVGVAPHQYVEFAALRGDKSDNLPGVPGIGPKRAKSLLAAFATVAEAAADPIGLRSVVGPGPGQALLDDLADPATSVFLRNVHLMSIRRDLHIGLDDCRRAATPERLADGLERWGLASLAGRVGAALGVRPDAPPPPSDEHVPF
jgi:DNA polymerase I